MRSWKQRGCGMLLIALASFFLTIGSSSNVAAQSDQHRTVNLSLNPIGPIFGAYGVSMSVALGSNLALRGDVNYYDPLDDDDVGEGFEVGVGVPIYFRSVYSGLFFEPGAILRRTDVRGDQVTEVGPQVLLGYHWLWRSGLNIAVAAGVGRNISPDETRDELFGNAYLRFGYAF